MAARKKTEKRTTGSADRKRPTAKKDSPTRKKAKKALARAQAEVQLLRALDRRGLLTRKKLLAELEEVDDSLAVMVHMIRFFV